MSFPDPDPAFSFTTNRLEIRHLLPQHAKFVSELYSSPVFHKSAAAPTTFSEERALQLLQGLFGDVQRKFGYGQFLVSLRETATPIGTVSLMRGEHYSCPDVGYAIFGEYNGQGYATEAAIGLIAYATKHWGLQGVFAFMAASDMHSQRVAEKIGLQHRGTRCLVAFGGKESAVWALPVMDEDLTVYGIANDA